MCNYFDIEIHVTAAVDCALFLAVFILAVAALYASGESVILLFDC